jgi:Protein of unknown function (DUF3551)
LKQHRLTVSRLFNCVMRSMRETWARIAFNLQAPNRFGRMARVSSLAAFSLGVAGSLSPRAAPAQEYPWCVSREGYLDCAYTTHQQCQWTASGIGGCELNPRLLFPNKPGHPEAKSNNQPRDQLSRMY